MPSLSRIVLGGFFLAAGALHFIKPRPYESIMPEALPAHRELVYLSGVAEMAGGAGVLAEPTRRAAGWWLIATMLAVFPANINMAVEAERFATSPSRCCGRGCRCRRRSSTGSGAWRCGDATSAARPR